MDPFVTGSLISAGSSLLGGLFGRKERKSSTGQEMKQKIEMGKRYGLHPLASIGAQTSGYQPVMEQAFTSAGQAVQQGMAASADAKADAGRANKANALIDAQIAEAQSRTILNKANAQRALVGPGARLDPYAPRKENALVSVRLENGEIIQIPNPDLYEISPTELATGRLLIEGARGVSRAQRGYAPTGSPRVSTGQSSRRANANRNRGR